jgi:hypothetical protein
MQWQAWLWHTCISMTVTIMGSLHTANDGLTVLLRDIAISQAQAQTQKYNQE